MKPRCMIVLLLLVPASVSRAQNDLGVPQAVVESWSYLIGSWDVSGRVGSTQVNGSASFEWGADKSCYLGKQIWRTDQGDDTIHLALIGGWDAAEKVTVEQGFSSSGSSATVRYENPSSAKKANVIEGRIDGVSGPETKWAGVITLERHGPNEFHLTTTIDGRVVHSLRYARSGDDGGHSR